MKTLFLCFCLWLVAGCHKPAPVARESEPARYTITVYLRTNCLPLVVWTNCLHINIQFNEESEAIIRGGTDDLPKLVVPSLMLVWIVSVLEPTNQFRTQFDCEMFRADISPERFKPLQLSTQNLTMSQMLFVSDSNDVPMFINQIQ